MNQYFLVIQVGSGQLDAAVLVILLVDIGPVVPCGCGDRLGMDPRIDPFDKIELPLQALHLPDAKPHE